MYQGESMLGLDDSGREFAMVTVQVDAAVQWKLIRAVYFRCQK